MAYPPGPSCYPDGLRQVNARTRIEERQPAVRERLNLDLHPPRGYARLECAGFPATPETAPRPVPAETRPTLQIRLNGELVALDAPQSVSALLARHGIDPRGVAVERNLVVVKRVEYDRTIVGEGDEIEIVNFVGGG